MEWIIPTIVLLTAGITAIGIFYRIRMRRRDWDQWKSLYPKLEQLLAIYSVVAWKSPHQGPPCVTEDSEWSGKEFVLDTEIVDWESYRPGDLLRCFTLPVKVQVDGEEFYAPQLTSNEDYWYRFEWETVFGYELPVTVGHVDQPELLSDRDRLSDEIRIAAEGEGFEADVSIYLMKVTALPISGSVGFLVADGWLSWLANGGVDLRRQWVVYLPGSEEPLSVGALNRLIQQPLRHLQIAERDLAQVAPQLEVKWHARDRQFIEGIFSDLERAPNAATVLKSLKG